MRKLSGYLQVRQARENPRIFLQKPAHTYAQPGVLAGQEQPLRTCKCGGLIATIPLTAGRERWACGSCGRTEIMPKWPGQVVQRDDDNGPCGPGSAPKGTVLHHGELGPQGLLFSGRQGAQLTQRMGLYGLHPKNTNASDATGQPK